MNRFLIILGLTAGLVGCSKGSDKCCNPDVAAQDSSGHALGVINIRNDAPDSTFVQDMTIKEDGTELSYRRVSRRVSTPDSLVYLDMVCDYIPGDQSYITAVAKSLDRSTLMVRNLEATNLPASTFDGPDAVEKTIAAIANDFSSRVYLELKSDSSIYETAQYALVNELVNYVSPKVLTRSSYSETYTMGAAHGASAYELTTIDRATGQALTLEQIVKKDEMDDVREDLVETIARAKGFKEEKDFLKQTGEFVNNDANSMTEDNFPIYNVGLTREGLTFVYPLYSIAPYSDGIGVYTLPYRKIKDDINY